MPHGALLQLTDSTFADAVEAQGGNVMVEFWASWCMPCKMLEPIVKQIAGEFDGVLRVAQVDTDQNRELAHRFEVSAVPTILIFKDGKPVHRYVGLTGYDKLASAIEGLSTSEAAAG